MASFSDLTFEEYKRIVKSEIIFPRIKIDVLNVDETVNYEIVSDLVDNAGNLNISFSNIGVRRTCSLNLVNIDGEYTPNPDSSGFWITDKFKLYLGLRDNGIDYWKSNGVFVHSNPKRHRGDSDKIMKISAIDKFSLLDGSLSGKIENSYFIPKGENIHDAIKSLLLLDRGDGQPIDPIPPLLDVDTSTDVTGYDIFIESQGTIMDVLNSLTDQISSYCFYDGNGVLNVTSGTRDLGDNNKGSIWDYTNKSGELLDNNDEYDYKSVRNKYVVVGENIDGAIVRGEAYNNNPFSGTRIGRIPTIVDIVTVATIDTNIKAEDYAKLKLKEVSMLNIEKQILSTFMIHLDVNEVVTYTDTESGEEAERFLIQSVSIPLGTNSSIMLNTSNVNQLPFYEGAG